MGNGQKLAKRVEKLLGRAGRLSGDGPLICTLRKAEEGGPQTPWDATPEVAANLHELFAVQSTIRKRDSSGTLIGESVRSLAVNATGAVPEKGDEIAIGVAMADISADTSFEIIALVDEVAPGGVALMYELELES